MSDFKPSDKDLIALVITHAQYNSIFDNEKVYLIQIANRLEARGKEISELNIKVHDEGEYSDNLHDLLDDIAVRCEVNREFRCYENEKEKLIGEMCDYIDNLKDEVKRLNAIINHPKKSGTYSPIRTRTDTPPPPPSEE